MKSPSDGLKARLFAWIAENSLIAPGDRVLCGLSGGADSVAMTLFLWENRENLKIEVSAAHVNHMLRGAEADRDEEFCRALCEKQGIPFAAYRGDAAARARELGTGLEDGARELRYSFFNSANADKIAVAHNSDDNLETIVMRLARGGGARGLAGIPPKNGKIIRPVMALARDEIETLCASYGAAWVTDSTNSEDAYTRNRIRHGILAELKAMNPRASALALENSRFLREEDAFLDAEAQSLMAEGLTAELLIKTDPVLSRRMLRLEAGRHGLSLEGKTVEKLLEICRMGKSRASFSVPGGMFFLEYGRVFFGRKPQAEPFCLVLAPGTAVNAGEWRVEMQKASKENKNIYRKFNICPLASDKIHGELKIRPATGEDSFRRNEKSGTKKLRKLYSDMKLPMDERESLPVLADSLGVIFVPGIGTNFSRRDALGEDFEIVFQRENKNSIR